MSLHAHNYRSWLDNREQLPESTGIDGENLHEALFPFQRDLTAWNLSRGRSATFADCGLGKTLIQLVWADTIARKADRPVLILTPLAVSHQTIQEGEKFRIECVRSHDGTFGPARIVVTNYERLHYFNSDDFVAVVCDESSILKNFDGKRRGAITEFLRTVPYRLLCTATASPNDYIELGTSSEAIGDLGYMDMLGMFFKNDESSLHPMSRQSKWRFKHHAELPFWRWVCSWARALRRPSDLGYDDGEFRLPELIERETIIKASCPRKGMLFDVPAMNLHEQREERRRTIPERCQAAADIVNDTGEAAVMWCHLNAEADMLTELVPDAEQVAGSDSDESKEAKFLAFSRGDLRVMVTKPRIGAFGLNWQHCAHETFFPSHSYEQYYQGVRRCWRYGQKRKVVIDIISSEGETAVLANLKRKNEAATKMFDSLVSCMHESMAMRQDNRFINAQEVPAWL